MNRINTLKHTLGRQAGAQAMRLLLAWLGRGSDRDVTRLIRLAERLAPNPRDKQLVRRVRHSWETQDSIGQLLRRYIRDLNPRTRRFVATNLLLNNAWGPTRARRAAFEAKAGFRLPFVYLISPSMRCNLHCAGCYASEYTTEDDLPIEVVDRVLTEGEAMGIYFVTVLGGEPFVRTDMWEMYQKHRDVLFMVFTNGTPLTPKNVDRLAALGNVIPVVSIEGWEDDTDARRGQGVFKSIMAAFDRLRAAGVLFGFSSMITRRNLETICSDAFNRMLVEKGCMFGWHFLYMPVGRSPDLSLMPTPEQRNYLRRHGAFRIRETMPLLVMDFWNDAPLVGGCIAAGREYFHINNRGDVEPCIFTHFATDNVKEKSLGECLQSPFFRAIRARQPYNDNLLMPCMLIDNPGVFREICAECHPYPTHAGAESLVGELAPGLDAYAGHLAEIMDEAWREDWIAQGRIWPFVPEEEAAQIGLTPGKAQKAERAVLASRPHVR